MPAHDDRNRAEDVVHEWAVIPNHGADAAAKLANLNRPSDFRELWHTVRVRANVEAGRAAKILVLFTHSCTQGLPE